MMGCFFFFMHIIVLSLPSLLDQGSGVQTSDVALLAI